MPAQPATPRTEKPPKRRTQAERRDAMRMRLLKATLHCLARDGYAGTTVSSIVKRAGVSRGAHLHHYPTKNALILDAAAYLMRRAYRLLGQVLLNIASDEDRLQALLEASWREIYDTRTWGAYSELLIASQRDKELAAALRSLSSSVRQTLDTPIDHYFEKLSTRSERPQDMFAATALMLGAMAATSHLVTDPSEARRHLKLWGRLMAGQMRAREGIKGPPPRPITWHRGDD